MCACVCVRACPCVHACVHTFVQLGRGTGRKGHRGAEKCRKVSHTWLPSISSQHHHCACNSLMAGNALLQTCSSLCGGLPVKMPLLPDSLSYNPHQAQGIHISFPTSPEVQLNSYAVTSPSDHQSADRQPTSCLAYPRIVSTGLRHAEASSGRTLSMANHILALKASSRSKQHPHPMPLAKQCYMTDLNPAGYEIPTLPCA